MDIKTTFDIGESVYYFNGKKGKICQGEVMSIGLFVSENNVEEVLHIREKGGNGFRMPDNISPSMVFRKRDDVFEFCYKLTEGI